MSKILSLTLLYSLAILSIVGCGNQDAIKAEKIINTGLVADADCLLLPIESKIYGFNNFKPDSPIGLLKSKGYIAEGKVTELNPLAGKGKQVVDAYVLTEKGKALVQKAGTPTGFGGRSLYCMRTGTFQVSKIEAIDYGNDAEGKHIASIRARIKFIPEEWISDTITNPQFGGFWKRIGEWEKSPWLYQLLKSGDDMYGFRSGRKMQ